MRVVLTNQRLTPAVIGNVASTGAVIAAHVLLVNPAMMDIANYRVVMVRYRGRVMELVARNIAMMGH